jgi:hypothetical protein
MELFPSLREETRLPPPPGFRKYECELYFEAPIDSTTTQYQCFYRTSNQRLAIKTSRWSTIPFSRYTRLCHFCSYNAIENEAHFVLKCPQHKPIRESNGNGMQISDF